MVETPKAASKRKKFYAPSKRRKPGKHFDRRPELLRRGRGRPDQNPHLLGRWNAHNGSWSCRDASRRQPISSNDRSVEVAQTWKEAACDLSTGKLKPKETTVS